MFEFINTPFGYFMAGFISAMGLVAFIGFFVVKWPHEPPQTTVL